VVQFSPDGSRLVALTSSGEAYVANAAGGGVVRFAETVSLAQTVAFSPDQRRCAIPGFDGDVLVFELATGKRLARLTGRSGALLSATFNPDGTRLFAGSLDGFVNVWDLTTERELASVRAHQASVFSMVFTPEGTLVTAAVDGFRFWRTEAETPAP
jgi:WD40 repeat protein